MPNLGPQYDMAVRLAALEDTVRRMQANPLAQAFSMTQSDGSVGMELGQDPATGSGRWIVHQGVTTPRDPDTAQHPPLMYMGELYAGGVPIDSGVIFYRPDGSTSMDIDNTGVRIVDAAGNIIVNNDETSGQGIARPYLPGAFYPAQAGDFLATAATSWATLWRAKMSNQHPKLYVEAWAWADAADTTGQVQILVNGATFGGVQSASNGVVVLYTWGPLAVAGSFGDTLSVEIQAQRTAGTGNVKVGAAWVEGVQS